MNISLKKIILSLLIGIMPNIVSAGDDGPRMYWNGPVGLNILQAYYWNISGNSITPKGTLRDPNIDADMDLLVLGYNRIFDVEGRALILTSVVTAGNMNVGVDVLNRGRSGSGNGFGDLYFQGTLNLIGAPALSATAFADYKQDTVLSLLVGVTAPTGNYDANKLLNMSENRWNLRVGLPFIQTLGEWIPGEITTLEILPSAWFYGSNDDAFGGAKLTQDPLYTLEAHITRDITPALYVSLDYFLQTGGETSTDGIKNDDDQTSDSIGLSLGYMVNAQAQLMLRYSSSLNPSTKELDVDVWQFNLNYYW